MSRSITVEIPEITNNRPAAAIVETQQSHDDYELFESGSRSFLRDDNSSESESRGGGRHKVAKVVRVVSTVTNMSKRKSVTSLADGAIPQNSSGVAVESSSTAVAKAAEDLLHPFWQTFNSSDMEEDYCQFAYVHSGFYGGKLWHALAFAIALITFFYYHTIMHGFSGTMFIKEYWVALTISAITTAVMFACCMIEKYAPYRETFFLLSLLTHWPAFLITFMFGMGKPYGYGYLIVIGCWFFCAFVVQARFVRVVWLLSVSPITTLIITTSTFSYSFWDFHSALEVVLWLTVVYPVYLLRVYERNSRLSFIRMMRCEKKIHEIESKIEKTQQLIAKFFPKTPTLDLLTEGRHLTRCKVYHDTAMVVTDLAGFTAWTSRTPPSVVISTLSLMFENIDSQLEDHFIEKVSTIGDAFIGASFPCSFLNTEQRCSITISFCCNILPYGGELQLRIGTHIGEVTGAFVGSAPPKFDIFGEDVEIAKVMEQDGVPGKVHITPKMLALAEAHGHPTEREQGKSGIVTEGWIMSHSMIKTVFSHDNAIETQTVSVSSLPPDENEQNEVNRNAMNPVPPRRSEQRYAMTGNSREETEDAATGSKEGDGEQAGSGSYEFSQAEVYKISQALTTMGQQVKEAPSMMTEESVEAFVPGFMESSAAASAPCTPSGGSAIIATLGLSVRRDSAVRLKAGDGGEGTDLQQTTAGGGRRGSLVAEASMVSGNSSQAAIALIMDLSPKLHPFFLTFANPVHERLFARFLAKANLTDIVLFTFTVMQLHFFLAYLLLGCLDTVRNRLLCSGILLILICTVIIFRGRATKIPRLTAVVMGTYTAMMILSLFMDANCDSQAIYYTNVYISANFLMMFLSSQFLLHNRLTIRLALNLSVVALGLTANAVRTYGIQDDAFPFDPIWLIAILGLGFVSYFADFTLRSAFVADRKLMSVLRLTKGRHHKTTKGALEVMLPEFVTARLLGEDHIQVDASAEKAREEGRAVNGQDDDDDDFGSEMSLNQSFMEEDVLDTTDLSGSAKLWEFHSVGVMFVYFNTHHQGSEERHIEIINEAFSTIEGILKAANIHKIKTIGTAVMCVYGINDDESDPVNTVVCAAIEIRRRVLEKRVGWTYTFGIHLGPCTGAVMGTESLMFDIFGDSVNMASRMASTAPPKGIQLSPGAAVALSDDFKTEKRPPIQVKGKGQIEPILVRV